MKNAITNNGMEIHEEKKHIKITHGYVYVRRYCWKSRMIWAQKSVQLQSACTFKTFTSIAFSLPCRFDRTMFVSDDSLIGKNVSFGREKCTNDIIKQIINFSFHSQYQLLLARATHSSISIGHA